MKYARTHEQFSRGAIVASVLGALLLSGCSAPNQEPEQSSVPTIPLAQAVQDDPDSILPTQSEIRNQKTFPYLMASPSTEYFSAADWQKTTSRIPATQQEAMSSDPATVEAVNKTCSVYEQLGLGLVTTPSGDFQTVEGQRRRIAVGQSGINQLTGYTSVFATADIATATELLSAFGKDAVSCGSALKNLYPEKSEDFRFDSVSTKPSAGTYTLTGTYSGDSFMLKVNQVDNCLVATWFRTIDQGSDENLADTTETIHQLALDNALEFAPHPG